MVLLVVNDGWPMSRVADRFQCAYGTVRKWVTRYRAGEPGSAEGLVDLRVYAASVAAGFMMSSNSMGVSFPSRR